MLQLTEKQKSVLKAVHSANPGDMIILRGFAGTGKTVTASTIINQLNKKTLVVAPTAAALSAVKEKLESLTGFGVGSITFSTLASLMEKAQTVLKFGNVMTYYPVITPYSLKENDEQSSKRYPLQSVYDVVRSIAKLHPQLTESKVSECFHIKFYNKFDVVAFKNEKEFIKHFKDMEKTDDTYFFNKYYLTIDVVKLEKLIKSVFKINPFGTISEDVVFDFINKASVLEKLMRYQLVVIDEMSMISDDKALYYESILDEFKERRISANIPVHNLPITLICGDPGQLEPVQGNFNKWCDAEENGVNVFELTDVLRSTDDIANFANLIRQNVSLNTLVDGKRVKRYDRNVSISQIYAENENVFKNCDMALAFTNKDVFELNEKIRYSKGFIGYVQAGDKLVVNENTGRTPNAQIVHANGSIYSVVKDLTTAFKAYLSNLHVSGKIIDEILDALDNEIIKCVKVKTSDGTVKCILVSSNAYDTHRNLKLKELKNLINTATRSVLNAELFKDFYLRYLPEVHRISDVGMPYLVDVKYAHAMTVHKSQGSQFDNVVYVVSSKDLWIQSQNSTNSRFKQAPIYVAVSRAKKNVNIYYLK